MTENDWSYIQAIIFDMDGTLVDTERLWKQAEADLLAHHGRQYDDAIHAPYFGLEIGDLIGAMCHGYQLEHLDQYALTDELHERVGNYLQTETTPQKGAVALVQALGEQQVPCAIATNSSGRIMLATLKNQAWVKPILVRCHADQVEQGKPAPDLYLLAAQQLGFAPSLCIAIEDSPNGARAAVAAGMTCLAVPEAGRTSRQAFADITPFIFADLTLVHEFLIERQVLKPNP